MAYLDHAAATPLRPNARDAWLATSEQFGNASSLHQSGRAARRFVEESRERIAQSLAVAPSEIHFTSGGTEADNLGVIGTYRARHRGNTDRVVIVHSAIEHKAVLGPVASLAEEGAHAIPLPVDAAGTVDPQELKAALVAHSDRIAVVAVMYANNEVGSVQPVAEIASMCADFDVPFHCDAVQALGSLALDISAVTSVALSAHKVGGPFGVGVLVASTEAEIAPLLVGGGHESGLRAGTLNAPGIVSAAVAIEAAVLGQEVQAARLAHLRETLATGVLQLVPEARENSSAAGLPGIVNITFPGCEGDALMMLLDAAGVCVSTGSACTVGIPQPSHVLQAMGASDQDARSALRFSLGWDSTEVDVQAALAAMPEVVARARRAGLISRNGQA